MRLNSMRVQIVSFSGNMQTIIASERKFPSEAIILLINANEKEKIDENLVQAIKSLQEYYKFHEITPEVRYISSEKDFPSMVGEIAKIILSQAPTDSILINAVGGSQDLAFALLSAGLLVRQDYDREISFVLFSGDQRGSLNLKTPFGFNPLPLKIPDASDKILLEEVGKGGTLHEYAKELSLSKGTISQRVRTLADYGFIEINGRDRNLTAEGRMIVEINKAATAALSSRTHFDLDSLSNFIKDCKRSGGFTHSPSSNAVNILNTFGALNCLLLLGEDLDEMSDIEFKFKVKNKYLNINQAKRRFRANSRTLHRIISICKILNTIDKIPKKGIEEFLLRLYDQDTNGYMYKVGSGEPNIQRTWEVVQISKILGITEIPLPDEFLRSCMVEGGGYKYEPDLSEPNIASTFNGLSTAKLLEIALPDDFKAQTIQYIKSRWKGRFFVSSSETSFNIWTNHDAILCLKLLGEEYTPYKEHILSLVLKCQDASGGFKDFINAPSRKVSCAHSYGALGLISMLDPSHTEGREINPLFDRPRV